MKKQIREKLEPVAAPKPKNEFIELLKSLRTDRIVQVERGTIIYPKGEPNEGAN